MRPVITEQLGQMCNQRQLFQHDVLLSSAPITLFHNCYEH